MRRPDPAVLRLIVFLGALVGVLVLFIVFRKIFQPLLLGLLVAYLLDPAVDWFERRGRSRTFGVILITLLLLLAIVAFFLFVVPAIGDQVERLADRLPEYQELVREQVQPFFERLEARYPEEIEEIQQRTVQGLRDNLPVVAQKFGEALSQIFSSLFYSLLFVLNLVFVPVFAFYLLVDFPKVKNGIVDLIPLPYREIVVARVSEVNDAVASFLRGQLTIALILASINATGLLIIDVPLGLAIGLVAGLANMIPYMALIVGLAPALLLCWVEHQSWVRLVAVLAVFGGAQLLEGTVLSPRILSRSVNLHPVWVLLAIIAGGSLFGFFGMILAVPVAAAIQVFAKYWLQLYRESAIYRRPGELPVETDASDPPSASGL